MDAYVRVDCGNDITSSAVPQAINSSHLMYNLMKGNMGFEEFIILFIAYGLLCLLLDKRKCLDY